MELSARRTYRLSLVVGISLCVSYALDFPLPFLSPIFALLLSLKPGDAIGLKGLVGVGLLICITLSMGLMLIPMVTHYSLTGLCLVAVGIYLSTILTVNRQQKLVGFFLILGFTLISVAGSFSFTLALEIIDSLLLAICCAVFCQWLVFPFFPEKVEKKTEAEVKENNNNWIALSSVVIVLPVYIFTLTNPLAYMPVIMKSVSLSQQGSRLNMANAGNELLVSTMLGGLLSIAVWVILDINANLWIFTLLIFSCGLFVFSRIYDVVKSRFSVSVWVNAFITMLLLLGPALMDSSSGKDVYSAFLFRMSLFVVVTLYAWSIFGLLNTIKVARKKKLKLAKSN